MITITNIYIIKFTIYLLKFRHITGNSIQGGFHSSYSVLNRNLLLYYFHIQVRLPALLCSPAAQWIRSSHVYIRNVYSYMLIFLDQAVLQFTYSMPRKSLPMYIVYKLAFYKCTELLSAWICSSLLILISSIQLKRLVRFD